MQDLSECVEAAQVALDDKRVRALIYVFDADGLTTSTATETPKPRKRHEVQPDAGKRIQTREALRAIAKGNGGSLRAPLTSLQIAGATTSDLGEWADSLREMAL